MKKLAVILSHINKSLAFEWIAEGLKRDFDLHFILLFPGHSELESFLREREIKVFPVFHQRKRDLFGSTIAIRKILKREKIEMVHAHLLDAGLAGLTAAWSAGIRKRIYTRHHATSHHVYHPHAVRYDRIINRLATHLVAVSLNVKHVLMEMEHVQEKKISVIHHGFDLEAFAHPDPVKVKLLEEKYNPQQRKPVIGVISRYIELKGIQFTIRAFKNLLETAPNAYLILANASGKYRQEILRLLSELPLGSYREILFENDLVSLYQLFSIHVHVPVESHSEAFGQTYVEALAAGIPSVFTLSGVAPEFIRDRSNAWVVPFKDSDAIEKGVMEILKNTDLRRSLVSQGKKDVTVLFGIDTMLKALKNLYGN